MMNTYSILEVIPKIDRSHWFRLPERETTACKTKFVVGTRVHWSRSVGRAGYYVSPTDMPYDLETVRIIEYLEKSDIDMATWNTVMQTLSREPGCTYLPTYSGFRAATGQIRRFVRGYWLKEEKKKYQSEIDCNLRTFWYVDHDPIEGKIAEAKMRWIGGYSPGYVSGGYEYSEWEPPYLSQSILQRLYVCYPLQTTKVPEGIENPFLVHPLDLEVIE